MPATFADLGVPSSLTRVLASQGINEPFEVQAAAIPDALAGRDICGRAPTGSGKTIAFGVPVIVRTAGSRPKAPSALVLAPTRELAEQIADELRPLAQAHDLWVLSAYGGTNIKRQIDRLKKGVDILVACPGRLQDLIDRKALTLDSARTVVIDEADRMADMGFLPDVRRLLDLTPSDRQTLLFSATLDKDVAALTREYQADPVRHEVGPETPDIGRLQHHFWAVDRNERVKVAVNLIRRTGKTVVFTRTRHGADRAAKQLERDGLEAAVIHGARSQNQRDRALAHFSDGEALVLVATDVAARGIHVDGVECVLHFDPPEDGKAYVHRSGRTARAGATGTVVCFVDKSQRKAVKQLQREVGIDVQVVDPDLEGFGDARPLAPRPQKSGGHNEKGSRPQSRKPSGGQGRGKGGKSKPKTQNRQEGQGSGKHQSSGTSGKPAGKRNSGSKGKPGGKGQQGNGGKPGGKGQQGNGGKPGSKGQQGNVGKPGGKGKSKKRKPTSGKSGKPQGVKRGNGYPKSKQGPNRKKAAQQRQH